MVAISQLWYNGSYTIAAKPIKTLESHYTMIQFLIKTVIQRQPKQNSTLHSSYKILQDPNALLASVVNKLSLCLVSASAMCTTNCSHFLDCESHHGLYQCTCQAGFTGRNCEINIDECSVSPCVNGRCVDGINRYDCVCNDGYWGTNCEKKIHNREGKLRNIASGKIMVAVLSTHVPVQVFLCSFGR